MNRKDTENAKNGRNPEKVFAIFAVKNLGRVQKRPIHVYKFVVKLSFRGPPRNLFMMLVERFLALKSSLGMTDQG